MELAKPVSVGRISVEGSCSECGAATLQRYEILSDGGWFRVVKCQTCLASMERTPWNPLGYVKRDHADMIIHSGKAARL